MNDALSMRGFEGLCDLSSNREGFIDWYRAVRDPIRQRWPLDELEDQRMNGRLP